MDVVQADMNETGVAENDAIGKVGWRNVNFCCGDPRWEKPSGKEIYAYTNLRSAMHCQLGVITAINWCPSV